MKKILKIILSIICIIVGIVLLSEVITNIKESDPWGLGFMFFTLPIGSFGLLFLVAGLSLAKDIFNSNTSMKNLLSKILLIISFIPFILLICIFIKDMIVGVGVSPSLDPNYINSMSESYKYGLEALKYDLYLLFDNGLRTLSLSIFAICIGYQVTYFYLKRKKKI